MTGLDDEERVQASIEHKKAELELLKVVTRKLIEKLETDIDARRQLLEAIKRGKVETPKT